MLATTPDDLSQFSGKIRVRVCGLLVEKDHLLMIKHESLGPKGYLWIPPGGGVNYKESTTEALKRELLEETGLEVDVREFLFVFEVRTRIHHAIELFYTVVRKSGELKLGKDPELADSSQIMTEMKMIPFKELAKMDKETLHGIFSVANSPENVSELRGLFSFNH